MTIKTIIKYFIAWRVILLIFLFLAIQILPLQFNFLGGGLSNYLEKPYLWAWANYDGEHYLNIARNGYGFLEHAFFPLFPFSMRFLGRIFGGSLSEMTKIGIVLSNFSFIIALVGLLKLIRLDYKEDIVFLTLLILLFFPTSFYFGSVYTESTFLAMSVWSFYYARKQKWFTSSAFGSLASATRFLGILLLPAVFIEMYKKREINRKNLITLLIIPLGLAFFMNYLRLTESDPLKFIRVLPGYGEQRQITPVILPQVFYRYLVKILPNLNYDFFPIVFTTYLELVVALIFLLLVILLFFKSRLSYAVYSAGLYIVPTLTGSFSSLPRYVIVIFPAFILLAQYLAKIPKVARALVFAALLVALFYSTILFVRGYWVS